MLQNIRNNTQSVGAKIIIGLIVVSFSIFGIESILLGGGGSGVAEVNGEDISPQELQQAVNGQKRRLIAMMGDNLDPAMLDDDRLSSAALQDLIARKLLMQSAEDMNLSVSEATIGRIVATMEQFQVNGQFDPDLYKSSLANAGFTPASFKETLREDLLVSQLRTGLAASDFATDLEVGVTARVATETRDLRYMTLPLQDFMDAVEVSDADIEAYYEENAAQFATPETVELDYIELSADAFRQPVAEERLREEYRLELDGMDVGVRHRVSHILFEGDAGDRIAQAQAALAEGRDFAEVAAQYSDDIGSSGNGGDLGYTSGDTFPEPMEQVIAALEPGTVSEPVQTDAGVHLILVTTREDAEPPTFEEMRMQIEDRLQSAEARTELLRTVEELKDAVYVAEDLTGPAEELGLQVQRSEAISRNHAQGLFSNPTLLAQAFSDEVLEQGHNSEVVELAGGNWLVLRVARHNDASVQPLEEVRDEVQAAVMEARASEALEAAAQVAVASLRAGVALDAYAVAQGYAWQVQPDAQRRNPLVPRAVLQRAFQLPQPAEGESTFEYVIAPSGDAQVFELTDVNPGSVEQLPEPQQNQLRQAVTGEYGLLIDNQFQAGLRERADISVL